MTWCCTHVRRVARQGPMHTFCKWAGFVSDAPGEEKDLYTNILQFHTSLPDGTWEGVLTYRAFTHFLGTGRLACPRASLCEAEIMDMDKSKGDRGP